MKLEELLRTTITLPENLCNDLELPIPTKVSPEFVITIKDTKPYGVRIIVRAHGEDSETLDFMVRGNDLQQDDFGPVIPTKNPHYCLTIVDGTRTESCSMCGAIRGDPHVGGCVLR